MKITLNKPSIYQVGRVRLLPGDNEISGNDVMKMMQNKIVQADIAAGILTVEHDTPKTVAKNNRKPRGKAISQTDKALQDNEEKTQQASPEAVKATVKRTRRKKVD